MTSLSFSRAASDVVPQITLTTSTKYANHEKTIAASNVIERGKKVLRGNIKSPGSKFNPSKLSDSKQSKDKIEACQSQLRKKDSELIRLQRKVNGLQTSVTDKEKVIKNLERKFPQMITELKKSLSHERKVNVDLKEAVKKLKKVIEEKKCIEDKLKLKDDKLKESKRESTRLLKEVNCKERENNEFRKRIKALEVTIPDLMSEVKTYDEDLLKYRERIALLEQTLACRSEEGRSNKDKISELTIQVSEQSADIEMKLSELMYLKASNSELHHELVEQQEVLERTKQETQQYLKTVNQFKDSFFASSVKSDRRRNSLDCLDKATEDFLDRVSIMSKEKDMSYRVKLSIRKSRGAGSSKASKESDGSHFQQESDFLQPSNVNNNNSSLASFQSIKHSSRNSGISGSENIFKMSNYSIPGQLDISSIQNIDQQKYLKFMNGTRESFCDEVFQDVSADIHRESDKIKLSEVSAPDSSIVSSLRSEESRSHDVSSDTCLRLEELDSKVQSLWQKLSVKDQSLIHCRSNEKQLANSLKKLNDDVKTFAKDTERFQKQVHVAKKLFDTPSSKQ